MQQENIGTILYLFLGPQIDISIPQRNTHNNLLSDAGMLNKATSEYHNVLKQNYMLQKKMMYIYTYTYMCCCVI